MVTKCVVPNCGNSCNAKLSVTLFSFPKDSKLVQKWVHATRAQYLKEIKSHHKVCSEHFEKNCILNHFGATRLAPGAIPTIFEWNRLNVGERGTQAQHTPFLAIRSVCSINNARSNNRVILPKTTLQGSPVPKIRIPPLVKRIPLPVSKCAAFNLIKSKPLMCDVILPERRKTSNHLSTDSTILCYEAPTSNPIEPNDLDSDDDGGSNGSEYALGDIGNYTLLTKKSRNYEEEDEEEVDDPHTNGKASDDGFNNPLLAEDCSRESSNSGSSLIEEIVDSLQDDTADHFRDVKDIPKSHLGDVIIEECSIIEEEIIPPEKASSPLSLAVYLKEKNLSLASKEVTGEHVVRKGAVDETTSAKSSNLGTSLQTLTKKRHPGSISVTESANIDELAEEEFEKIRSTFASSPTSKVVILEKTGQIDNKSETVQDNKSKLRKLQPRLQKVKAKVPKISLSSDAASISSLTSSTTTAVTVNPVTNVSGPQTVKTYLLQQSNSAMLTTPQIKINQLYPPVNGVVSPMVFQVGNMVLPVASPLVKTTQLAVQKNAPNLVNLIAPQMTYLIPFSGVIPPPLAIKTSNCSDTGELMISGGGQNVIISPEASPKDKLVTSQKIRQKKRASCNAVDEKTSNGTQSTCRIVESDSMDGRSKNEERSSLKMQEMKIALKKKDILLKKLKKDKMNLAQKLRTLRRAFLKLRKASIVNLSSAKYLEVG